MYIYYILIFVASFLLTLLVRKAALAKKIMDIPNERSSHKLPTPRGGGLAIVILWYAYLGFDFFWGEKTDNTLFYMLLPGLLIVAVGLLDDIFSMPAEIRIAIQAVSAALALWAAGGLTQLDFGFFVFENQYILTIAAFFGIIWFINLFNFLDGIDGYIGLETVLIFGMIFLVFSDMTALVMPAAVAGFLVLNWQPAKIFMGDVGSTLIGYTVAVFAVYYQNSAEISLLTILILSSLFWFDATYTLFRRFRNNEKLTQAHKKHAYQRMVQSGFSHQKTVVIALIFNIINLALFYAAYCYSDYLLVFFVMSALVGFLFTKYADKRKAFI